MSKASKARSAQPGVRRIAMLTLHGYVDAKPVLGKTDTGGQVVYVLELSKALARKGIKVDIYTRRFQKRKTEEKVAPNVRIIRIPCGGDRFINKERLLPHLGRFADNMLKYMEKEGLEYDIFHSHYWDAGYTAMKVTEKLGHFFIHTFHSLGAWKKEHMGGDPKKAEKLYRFRERIKNEKLIFAKASSFVMTSSAMVTSSRKYYGYRKKNNVVIPAGVNASFYRPLKKGEKDRKIDVPRNYAFWVGRFDTNKGLDYLLRGFAAALPKTRDLFLVIGGGSKNPKPREETLRKELDRIIKKYELSNRVFFVRHIKDALMPSYYRQAEFFVLPSKFEPFGMTAAEAMACGCPVIVSKRAGIKKYLTSGKNCLSVNCSNKADLGWAFKVLDRNSTFRKKIAKNGLKLAKKKFSWESIADQSMEHYEMVMKNAASRHQKKPGSARERRKNAG
ncbi:MAG: glycosyltransferase [Candidatus Omnitrophica bacterium]|nr:glycosyltransferase [Candidatus Omnitrophota bacterium]